MPDLAVAPSIVRWSEHDSWQTPTRVPVRFAGAAPLTGASIAGAQAGDFSADDGGCRATSCTVQVGFGPTAAGARSAVLRLTDASGGVHDVALEGFHHAGISRTVVEDVLKTDLDPDRPPRTYLHEPPSSRFSGLLYPSGLATVYVDDADRWWQARFWPGAAGWQAGRRYSDAIRGSGGGDRPAMDVIGRDTVCNPSSEGASFTLHSISGEPRRRAAHARRELRPAVLRGRATAPGAARPLAVPRRRHIRRSPLGSYRARAPGSASYRPKSSRPGCRVTATRASPRAEIRASPVQAAAAGSTPTAGSAPADSEHAGRRGRRRRHSARRPVVVRGAPSADGLRAARPPAPLRLRRAATSCAAAFVQTGSSGAQAVTGCSDAEATTACTAARAPTRSTAARAATGCSSRSPATTSSRAGRAPTCSTAAAGATTARSPAPATGYAAASGSSAPRADRPQRGAAQHPARGGEMTGFAR